MDKAVEEKREMSLAAPLSAGALHQFLGAQPRGCGLKIKGGYARPVLKVREKAQVPDDTQRRLWSFYLKEMHQRLVGSDDAERAAAQIDSLLRAKAQKLGVDALLGPVGMLMRAEQARFARASSIVRRWIANERQVQQIATNSTGNDAPEKVERDKAALACAAQILEKFSDCVNGEIDIQRLQEEAYRIGHALGADEASRLHLAKFMLINKQVELASYIGAEVPLLIELCMFAAGQSLNDFRKSDAVKTLCLSIASQLRARTDTELYPVPPSPRTLAHRSPHRPALPGLAGGLAASGNGAPNPGRSNAPASPDGVEEVDGARLSLLLQGSMKPGSTEEKPLSPSARTRLVKPVSRSITDAAGAAPANDAQEGRTRILHKATTGHGAWPPLVQATVADTTAQTEMPGPGGADRQLARHKRQHVRSPSQLEREGGDAPDGVEGERRKLRRSMQYSQPPAQRLAAPSQDDPIASGFHEAAMDLAKGRKGQRSSQPSLPDLKKMFDSPQFRKRQEEAMAQTGPSDEGVLHGAIDPAILQRWNALQAKFGAALPDRDRQAVSLLLARCTPLGLQNPEEEALAEAVKAAGLQGTHWRALTRVRDLLLADNRAGANSLAAETFPELLSLLVFAVDAHRRLRKARN